MAINKETGLTDKQERFCQEFLIDLNATQSAIRSGYSVKTSYAIGGENLNKPEIQKRLNELRKPLAEKVGITQEMVLNEFAKIGFANIQDYFKEDLSPENLKELEEDKGRAISSIKRTTFKTDTYSTDTIEFKLHDKIKALENLGKHLGFFEKDNKQKDEAIKAPIINVYQSGPPLSESEKDVK